MPTPNKGESRKDFVSRCIPIVKKEDSDLSNKQAAGKCGGMYASHSSKKDLTFGEKEGLVRGAWQAVYGEDPELMYTWPRYVFEDYLVIQVRGKYVKVPYKWTKDGVEFSDPKKWSVVEHSFKGAIDHRLVNRPIRAVEAEDGRYRCYGVLFNDSEHRDAYGTYFDSNTKYHLDWYRTRPWLYHHGMHPMMGVTRVGVWDTHGIDEEGVFLEGELEASFKFKKAVETLLNEGVLYPSTGTMAYLLDVEEDGHVAEWPISEASSTVAPADFRQEPISQEAQTAVRALLSDGGLNMSKGKGLLSKIVPGFMTTKEPEAAAEEEVVAEVVVAPEPEQTPAPPEADAKTAAPADPQEVKVIDAIRALDACLARLTEQVGKNTEVLQKLNAPMAEKVKDAMEGGDWFKSLFVASRDGERAEETPEEPPEAKPLEPGESPLTRIIQSQP